jgi:hypothetical protein
MAWYLTTGEIQLVTLGLGFGGTVGTAIWGGPLIAIKREARVQRAAAFEKFLAGLERTCHAIDEDRTVPIARLEELGDMFAAVAVHGNTRTVTAAEAVLRELRRYTGREYPDPGQLERQVHVLINMCRREVRKAPIEWPATTEAARLPPPPAAPPTASS